MQPFLFDYKNAVKRMCLEEASMWFRWSLGILYFYEHSIMDYDHFIMYQIDTVSEMQKNFNGSNIFGTMEISSRQG